MVKKNGEKAETIKSSDETETAAVIEPAAGIDVVEATKPAGKTDAAVVAKSADGIDVTEILKSIGGIEASVTSASPMIEQIASLARSEAQRASAVAMREYRRRLHSITLELQGTIRDEGARVAEQICARLTEQVRRAVLLQTEKKALNLVDEFILGWQIEAENLSQNLLTAEEQPEGESLPLKQSKDAASVMEAAALAAEKKSPMPEGLKKQPEANETGQPEVEKGETENKVVFDFTTFIARSKSPVKA